MRKAAEDKRWQVLAETLVPDEKPQIQRALRELIDKGCQLILTTGGTVECLGFVAGAIPHCIEVFQQAPTSC